MPRESWGFLRGLQLHRKAREAGAGHGRVPPCEPRAPTWRRTWSAALRAGGENARRPHLTMECALLLACVLSAAGSGPPWASVRLGRVVQAGAHRGRWKGSVVSRERGAEGAPLRRSRALSPASLAGAPAVLPVLCGGRRSLSQRQQRRRIERWFVSAPHLSPSQSPPHSERLFRALCPFLLPALPRAKSASPNLLGALARFPDTVKSQKGDQKSFAPSQIPG